jgi:hypothetical protein
MKARYRPAGGKGPAGAHAERLRPGGRPHADRDPRELSAHDGTVAIPEALQPIWADRRRSDEHG